MLTERFRLPTPEGGLFIIGGGVSRQHAKFLPLLTLRTPVVVAAQFNDAGIIGAALAAAGEPPI